MSGLIVQARYEQLEQASRIFQEQQDRFEAVRASVNDQLRRLKAGGWLAEGASDFYRDMDNNVMPAITRLVRAFGEGAATTREVANLLKQAEEEAGGHLRGAGVEQSTPGDSGGSVPGDKYNDAQPKQGNPGDLPKQGTPVESNQPFNKTRDDAHLKQETYPNPRDLFNQYTNFDFWGMWGGQPFDLDESRLAADLVSQYLTGNPPSAEDLAFVRSVLEQAGYDNSEAAVALYQQIQASGNSAWLNSGTRDARAFAMELIRGMQAPVGFVTSMSVPGGGSLIPAPESALQVRDTLIRQAFPEIAGLEGEGWMSGPNGGNFQTSAAAVNGDIQQLNERGGDVVFDRFETTVSIPPGTDVETYFQGILANSPSSVGGEGFNNITQFSPNPNSAPFGPPIAGGVGLGSVYDINFLQGVPVIADNVDGGVMVVDANFTDTNGQFTFQAIGIEGRTLPEHGARQFGYTVEGVDAQGNQIVTIYTQATSRPSDPFTEIGGDIAQPVSWNWWLTDVGTNITQNGGTILGTDQFSTGSTD